jgi:hypothetical protein
MRALATCIAALCLAASPVLTKAAGPGGNDGPGVGTTNASTLPAQPGNAAANPAPNAAPSSAELESELQEVRELLESQTRQIAEQQHKMELLEEELRAAKAADPSADPSPAPINAAVTKDAPPAQEKNPDEPLAIHYKGVTLTPGGFMAAETVWRQKALAADVNTPLNNVPFDGSTNAHVGEFQASGRQSRISMLVEGKLENVKIGGYYEGDFLSAGTTSNNNQSNSYTFRQRQFWGQAAFNSGWTFTGGQMWSLLTETTKGMDNRSEALPQVIDAQYVAGFSWARQYGFRVTKNFNNKFWLGLAVEEQQATLTVHGNPTATCAPANGTLAVPTTTGTCSNSALNGTRVFAPTAAGGITTTVVGASSFNNFLLGQFGASGGLDNPLGNYQYNPSPDVVVKAVLEPGFGHYEIFGVFAQFRDRVFPCAITTAAAPVAGCGALPISGGSLPNVWSGAGAFNDSRTGGGLGANARWALFAKHVDLGVHFLGGTGIGRYGSVGLTDATIRWSNPANPRIAGTIAPLHNYQALGTVQLHPTSKLDINLYVGGEYSARASYQKGASATSVVGYGSPGFANWGCNAEIQSFAAQSTSTSTGVPTGVAGSNGFIPGVLQNCTGDTRNLIEGSIQFWYRFYKGPKGTIQYGMQYSNYVRNTWRGVPTGTGADGIAHTTNGQPHADENMIFTSFRYYLP